MDALEKLAEYIGVRFRNRTDEETNSGYSSSRNLEIRISTETASSSNRAVIERGDLPVILSPVLISAYVVLMIRSTLLNGKNWLSLVKPAFFARETKRSSAIPIDGSTLILVKR